MRFSGLIGAEKTENASIALRYEQMTAKSTSLELAADRTTLYLFISYINCGINADVATQRKMKWQLLKSANHNVENDLSTIRCEPYSRV